MRIFLFLMLIAFSLPSFAADPEKLGAEMGARINRVPEFEFIREEAEKLGVRAYIFGGTAAAYGHYVRQDLAREEGDTRYPKDLYDYDYTNIFRSTQDLDIVIDGSPAQAKELEEILKVQFPHFLGDKDAKWEVRPLRQTAGNKEALLGNPNFLNQNTDSHSTGLVEVTKTPLGEAAVKDVRDWDAKHPQFLQDVAEQKLHYYFSPLHSSTSRAAAGLNPPILSAIRYLTKAFQYELAIAPEDKSRIQKIIKDFKPADINNDYLKRWVEKNGKKLFQHAVDIEYAWNTIDELGLRQKLAAVNPNPDVVDSLTWWMNKQPLRSFAVGQGKGETAGARWGKEIIVSHETKSFLAFESLTRSKVGELNALLSRASAAGESALYGEGFYTRLGRKGAVGTGFTIRMMLDPNAREGSDFEVHDDYVILKNRQAVRVLPEKISISLPEFFRHLLDGNEFSRDDRALLEAFKRRAGRASLISPEDKEAVLEIVRTELAKRTPDPNVQREWFSLPLSTEYPELVQARLGKKSGMADIAYYVLSQAAWHGHPEFVEAMLASGKADRNLATNVLSKAHWQNHPEWVAQVLARGEADSEIAQYVLKQAFAAEHPEWVSGLIDKILAAGEADDKLDEKLASALALPHWQHHPELVEKLLGLGTANDRIVYDLLSKPHWQKQSQWARWVTEVIAGGKADFEIAAHILSQASSAEHPEWIATLLKRGSIDSMLASWALPQAHWANQPEFVAEILARKDQDVILAERVLTQPHWAGHPEFLETLIERRSVDSALNHTTLKMDHWANHPALKAAVNGEEVTVQNLRKAFEAGFTFRTPYRAPAGCAAEYNLLR